MADSLSQLVTSKKEVVSSNYLTSYEVGIRVKEIIGDLGSYTSPNLTGWYCKAYRLLGESMLTGIVSHCRSDTTIVNPKKIFGSMVKEQMAKRLKTR